MGSNFMNALAGSLVYPLTDRRLSGLSHTEQVAQLSEAGALLVQLREKILSSRDFYLDAEAALRVARRQGIKVIINDRVDIALALRADGVHLGQDDLPPAVARRLLGPEAIIGISTHSLDQACLAAKMPVDYIAIGPIFATSSKQTSDALVGVHSLPAVRQAIGAIPLVAIGGIGFKTGQSVLDSGADAIAIIRDIWASGGQLEALMNRFRHRS